MNHIGTKTIFIVKILSLVSKSKNIGNGRKRLHNVGKGKLKCVLHSRHVSSKMHDVQLCIYLQLIS